MAEAKLQVDLRTETGKQAAKRLKRDGRVPGILYGLKKDASPLNMNGRQLLDVLQKYGRNVVVNLAIGAKKETVKSFIYDIQHDPLSGSITHVDFKRISLDEKIHMSIPVRFEGVPEGVKTEGGIIEQVLHTIDISCLAGSIPETIVLDVSGLHIGDSIHISDITAVDYEILLEPEQTIVHVIAPKVVAATEEEEEELAGEESQEPEVIGKSEESEE